MTILREIHPLYNDTNIILQSQSKPNILIKKTTCIMHIWKQLSDKNVSKIQNLKS